jgi:hypothetical protein
MEIWGRALIRCANTVQVRGGDRPVLRILRDASLVVPCPGGRGKNCMRGT